MNRSASSPSSQILGADRLTTESKESTGGEHGHEQHLGVRQLSTDSADTPRSADAALERRLATGRESQRRFRERQKARAQEAEAKLSKATNELLELRNRQVELEARNQLLENTANVKRPVEAESLHQAEANPQTAPSLDNSPEADIPDPSAILIMVSQVPYCLTAEEASKLSIPAFSTLWTEHVRQIGGFLLQIGDPTASNVHDAVAAMQALTVEAFKLIQCLLYNPVANKVLVASRLDDGSPAVNSLDDDFYVSLLDLISLTDDQIQDVIIIQRVYMTRRASLDKQRQATVEQMGEHERQGLHPSDNFVALSVLAEQAHSVTAQDFQAYCDVISGLYKGVLSTQQLAGLMVHTYPFLPILVKMLDAVAARGGMHDLVIPPAALEDPEQLAADWGQFKAYVARIETQIWHDYVPLNMSSQVAVWPESD